MYFKLPSHHGSLSAALRAALVLGMVVGDASPQVRMMTLPFTNHDGLLTLPSS